VTVASVRGRLGVEVFLLSQLTQTGEVCEAPVARARADALAAPETWQSGPACNEDGGDVRARGTHDDRGNRLVAAREKHDRVERVGANPLLDVHRREVPIHHRRRLLERVARGHDRELERKPARLEHPSLNGLGEPSEVDVAADELTPHVADANYGA
jgi:hypothetical protein